MAKITDFLSGIYYYIEYLTIHSHKKLLYGNGPSTSIELLMFSISIGCRFASSFPSFQFLISENGSSIQHGLSSRALLAQSGILGYWSFFLGYCPSETGILGYPWAIWDIGILIIKKFGYLDIGFISLWLNAWKWDIGPLKLGYWDIGHLKLGYLGYQDPPNRAFPVRIYCNAVLHLKMWVGNLQIDVSTTWLSQSLRTWMNIICKENICRAIKIYFPGGRPTGYKFWCSLVKRFKF